MKTYVYKIVHFQKYKKRNILQITALQLTLFQHFYKTLVQKISFFEKTDNVFTTNARTSVSKY